MKIFAAENKDEKVRRESSAGGVFSVIAEKIIRSGGVVYGAAFSSDWKVKHQRIDNLQDLARLRGSKYVFSQYTETFSQITEDLSAGKTVLFSGTPCQVAVIKKRFGESENLILVEVVCHGAPEAKYWDKYLAEVCAKTHREISDILSVNFRDKRTGWKNYSFTVCFKDGKTITENHDDNLYMRAFLADLTLREACFKCPFKYPDGSSADITIGDFWGIIQLAPEIDNDRGTTIVIARTPRGEKLCQGIEQKKSFTLNQISKYNPAIISAPKYNETRARFLETITSDNRQLIHVLKKYAGRPLSEKIYLSLAKLKHKLLKR